MKTIKQLADQLGVDKQRVYRYIKKNRINESHQEAGVMWYDEAVENVIIQAFNKNNCVKNHKDEVHQTALNDASFDTIITMLQKELDIKNEQIKELNARLAESSAALENTTASLHAAQALHAGTMQKQLIGEKEDQTISDQQKPSFFNRIFNR